MEKTRLINLSGRLFDMSRPLVMGVINVTDDSFYHASRHLKPVDAVDTAVRFLSEGADIIDIGGCSTRPGSAGVTEEEERARIMPVLREIRRELPEAVISLDTYRSSIALEAVEASGIDIINDISGGTMDQNMFPTVAKLRIPYVMMHIRGTPENMQADTVYEDVVSDIVSWLGTRVAILLGEGVRDIIVDPGIGFGKNVSQNFEILSRLQDFKIIGLPIMVGVSRKSLIWRTLETEPSDALNGTTALNMAALMNGADILRVHDVREAVQTVKLFEKMRQSAPVQE
ncbi:MAG: dihydropteroate synthase [Bacteroidales bacterium]|nr:dihydropteroate synthase [Bacteroidales bacterium]